MNVLPIPPSLLGVDITRIKKGNRYLIDFPVGRLARILEVSYSTLRVISICQYRRLANAKWRRGRTLRQIAEFSNNNTSPVLFPQGLKIEETSCSRKRKKMDEEAEIPFQPSKKLKHFQLENILKEIVFDEKRRQRIMQITDETKKLGLDHRYFIHWIFASSLITNDEKIDLIDFLKSNNALFEAPDSLNRIPLHMAAACCSVFVLKALFSNGIYLDLHCDNLDNYEESPIHYAIKFHNNENAFFLMTKWPFALQEGCVYQNGATLLHAAVKFGFLSEGNIERLFERLSNDLDINELTDNDAQTILHYAVRFNPQCIELLQQFRCSSDVEDSRGNTPLHTCVILNRSELAQSIALLATGENFSHSNNANQNVFHCAFISATPNEQILDALIQVGISLVGEKIVREMFNERDTLDLSPLNYLLSKGKNGDKCKEVLARYAGEVTLEEFHPSSDLKCNICEDYLQKPTTTPVGLTFCRSHLIEKGVHSEDRLTYYPRNDVELVLDHLKISRRLETPIQEEIIRNLFDAGVRIDSVIFERSSKKRFRSLINFSNNKVFYYLDDHNWSTTLTLPIFKFVESDKKLKAEGLENLLKLFQPHGLFGGCGLAWRRTENELVLMIPLNRKLVRKKINLALPNLLSNKFVEKTVLKIVQNGLLLDASCIKEETIVWKSILDTLAISSYEDTAVLEDVELYSKMALLKLVELDRDWSIVYINDKGVLNKRRFSKEPEIS